MGSKETSDNGERLVDFDSAHRMCSSNSQFPHEVVPSNLVPTVSVLPSLKNYVLVNRLRPSVTDTKVFRGGPKQWPSLGDSNLMPQTEEEVQQEECYDTALLGKMEMGLKYVKTLRRLFNGINQQGSVEERWTELKEAPVGSAEQQLRRRWARKKWISDDLLSWLNWSKKNIGPSAKEWNSH